jgi:hypothetical protein
MRSRLWTVMRFEERTPGGIVLCCWGFCYVVVVPVLNLRYPQAPTSSYDPSGPPPRRATGYKAR